MTQSSNQNQLAQLKALGFSDAQIKTPRRIIASLSGKEKTSKTHIALTAPEPIFYFNMDNGGEGVVSRFQSIGKKIYSKPVRVPKSAPQNQYKEMWSGKEGVKPAILSVCEYNRGSGILDTSSELYELARLAEFGKLEQVMPHHYARVNSEWQKEILQAMYESDMTWILIHKVKPVWVNDKRTGNYEMAGFADTGYKVQMKLTTFRDMSEDEEGNPKLQFGFTVDDTRLAASLTGQEFRTVLPIRDDILIPDPVCNIETLLTRVHGAKK